MRLPTWPKPCSTEARVGGESASHSRAIIGPWLAANTPTRLAMMRCSLLRRLRARNFIEPADEFGVLHAADRVVEPQEIGVHMRCDSGNVVGLQRLPQFGRHRIARQHRV